MAATRGEATALRPTVCTEAGPVAPAMAAVSLTVRALPSATLPTGPGGGEKLRQPVLILFGRSSPELLQAMRGTGVLTGHDQGLLAGGRKPRPGEKGRRVGVAGPGVIDLGGDDGESVVWSVMGADDN